MVLSYDAYAETVDSKEEKESQVKELEDKYEKDMKEMREDMEIKFQKILEKIDVRQASMSYQMPLRTPCNVVSISGY